MKKMVKFLIPAMILAILMSISICAFSGVNEYEKKLIEYLNNPLTVGEKTYHVSEEYKTKAYNYLNRDDVELTQQEAATAEKEMEDLWTKIEKFETTDMTTLTDAQKTTVATEMQHVADVLKLKVTLDLAKDTITLTDNKGAVVADSTTTIKPTGTSSVAVVAVVATVAVVGCALVLNKKRVHG